jgi:hypothetical protein
LSLVANATKVRRDKTGGIQALLAFEDCTLSGLFASAHGQKAGNKLACYNVEGDFSSIWA